MTELTPTLVMTAFTVFCRVGGCLMLIPGFSSPRVPVRARLLVAVAASLALTPLLDAMVRPAVAAAAPPALLVLMLKEGARGVLIGLLGRFFFLALETAAMAVSLAIGMSSTIGAPLEGDEAMPAIVSFVSMGATLLIFATDLHWELFRGLALSYEVMRPDAGLDPRVSLIQLTDGAAKTFLFTLRIAAPFLVFSLVANVAVGLVNKLVPQIPVSYLAPPFLLAGGLVILYVTVHPALDLFITAFGGWVRSG